MHFMVIRRAGSGSESPAFPPPPLLDAVPAGRWLLPSERGARLAKSAQGWTVRDGPFPAGELIAGFTIIEAESKAAALDWAQRWPVADGEGDVVIEVREAGCSGGCAGFDTEAAAHLTPYLVLLKSNRDHEDDVPVPPAVIDRMMQRNREGVAAGIVLAGEGLQPSAKGARINFDKGRPAIVDGPFTEIKELIAGFWLIQAATRQQAYDWVMDYPYPLGPEVEIELREVFSPASR